jgi:putative transposase
VLSICSRNSFRYASRRDWPQIARDLKPIYTPPTEAAALERFADFAGRWEARYPAIVKLWENAWAEFVPFLSFDPEIRTVIYTTDEIVNRCGSVSWVASERREPRSRVRREAHARVPGRGAPSCCRRSWHHGCCRASTAARR